MCVCEAAVCRVVWGSVYGSRVENVGGVLNGCSGYVLAYGCVGVCRVCSACRVGVS